MYKVCLFLLDFISEFSTMIHLEAVNEESLQYSSRKTDPTDCSLRVVSRDIIQYRDWKLTQLLRRIPSTEFNQGGLMNIKL